MEYDEIFTWLLEDEELWNNGLSNDQLTPCLQTTAIDRDCCFHHESWPTHAGSQSANDEPQGNCSPPLPSRVGSQSANGELHPKGSPPVHGSPLISIADDHAPTRCGPEASSSSNYPRLVGENYGNKVTEEEEDVKPLKGVRIQQKEPTIDEVWPRKKHEQPRKQRRDAQKHSTLERNRRDNIRRKIRTLQTLLPNSNKFDAASVLGDAINYVKALKHHIQGMAIGCGGSPNLSCTSLSASTNACPFDQSLHVVPMGLVRTDVGSLGCFDGNAFPNTLCSLCTPLVTLPPAVAPTCASPNFSSYLMGAAYGAYQVPHCIFHSTNNLTIPTQSIQHHGG